MYGNNFNIKNAQNKLGRIQQKQQAVRASGGDVSNLKSRQQNLKQNIALYQSRNDGYGNPNPNHLANALANQGQNVFGNSKPPESLGQNGQLNNLPYKNPQGPTYDSIANILGQNGQQSNVGQAYSNLIGGPIQGQMKDMILNLFRWK